MTQRESQRLKTRDAILAEAARLFDLQGYLGTSMRDIAGALDLTVGAIFFHFKTKESIALELLRNFYAHWDEEIRRARREPGQRLEVLARLSITVAEAYRDDIEVAAAVRLVRDRSLSSTASPTPYLNWIEVVTGFLLRARDDGELRQDLDVDVVAYQFVCLFFGNQHISNDLAHRRDLPARLWQGWGLLIPAIAAPGVDLKWLTRQPLGL